MANTFSQLPVLGVEMKVTESVDTVYKKNVGSGSGGDGLGDSTAGNG
jgi:hypothetical protein